MTWGAYGCHFRIGGYEQLGAAHTTDILGLATNRRCKNTTFDKFFDAILGKGEEGTAK
jgi:hypothetical protein